MRRLCATVCSCVLLAIPMAEAWPDLVRFQAGGQVEAETRRDGDLVVTTSPEGRYHFPASAILQIVPGESPDAAWARRRAGVNLDNPGERHDLIVWALTHGFTAEALELLDNTPELLRDAPELARLLDVRASLLRTLEDSPPTGLVPGKAEFRTACSAHLLLLHQHDPAQAEKLLTQLESVVSTYYLLFVDAGLELEPPRSRLVVVWFARQADYREFLRREGAGGFQNSEGHYHPDKHLVAFYDERSSLRSLRTAHEIELHRARLGTLTSESTEAVHVRSEIDRLTLIEAQRRQEYETGTAIHELIHLLMWSSGLSPRVESLPIWLHEGLAMQFEVMSGSRWAGFSQPHPARLIDWRERCPSPQLAPLLADRGLGRSFDRVLYTQAWALVYHLLHDEPELLHDLITFLRQDPAPTMRASQRSLSYLAVQAPGGLNALESSWHRHIGRLSRPRPAVPEPTAPAPPTLTIRPASAVIQE